MLQSEEELQKQKEEENVASLTRAFSAAEKIEAEATHWILDSVWFNVGITSVVCLNTLSMGFEADNPHLTEVWVVFENFFTTCFFIEMLVKISVLHCEYFRDRGNWMDMILTLFGVLDCWVMSFIPGDSVDLQSMSILRILRLARLGRVIKLARKVKQFVLVISGVFKALVTTCWVFLLLVFVMYVCAIFCTEYIGRADGIENYPGYSIEDAVIDEQEIMQNYNPYLAFGTMKNSMLTLFNIAVGGEWSEIVRPIAVKNPIMVLLFVMYSMLIAFGVMNVMIGIIVDSVITESKNIDKEMQEKHKNEKRTLLDGIQSMIQEMDTNHDQVVDLEELKTSFKELPQLQDLLVRCDLPAGWASNELLFMLDNSGDGVLQKAEFTTSFFRLMDSDDFQQICIMQASINQVKHLVRQAHDKLELHMAEVRTNLREIRKAVDPSCAAEMDKQVVADTELDGESGDDANEQIHRTDKPEELPVEEGEAVKLAPTNEECRMGSFDESACQRDTANETQGLLKPIVQCKSVAHASMPNLPAVQPSETPSGALPGPKPTDAETGYELRSFTKELGSDIKGIPLKKITDLLDLAFLRMRDSLQRELAALSQGEEMSVIAQRHEALIPSFVPSAECSTSAEGNSLFNVTPVQEGFVEAASCYIPPAAKEKDAADMMILKDAADMMILTPYEGTHVEQRASRAEADRDVGWQELDGHLATIWNIDRLPNPDGDDNGEVVGEDFMSVASENLYRDTRALKDSRGICPSSDDHCVAIDVGFVDEERLGFEIQWLPDTLPVIRSTVPGGASDLRGIRRGDQVVQCSGISVQGKARDDVLRLLKQRPLKLKLHRNI